MSDNKNKEQTKNKINSATKPHHKKTNFKRGVAVHKFEGRCDDLAGIIFDNIDLRQKQAEAYANNIWELSIYCGREYKHGDDISIVIETLDVPNIDQDLPTTPDMTYSPEKWTLERRQYGRRKSKYT